MQVANILIKHSIEAGHVLFRLQIMHMNYVCLGKNAGVYARTDKLPYVPG